MTDRTLDPAWLDRVGLGSLDLQDARSFLEAVYAELQLRVGTRIAARMTPEQLSQFEAVQAEGDDVALAWMTANIPYRGDVVQLTFDEVTAEVAEAAPRILAELGSQPTTRVEPSSVREDEALPDDGVAPVVAEDEPVVADKGLAVAQEGPVVDHPGGAGSGGHGAEDAAPRGRAETIVRSVVEGLDALLGQDPPLGPQELAERIAALVDEAAAGHQLLGMEFTTRYTAANRPDDGELQTALRAELLQLCGRVLDAAWAEGVAP